MALSPSGKWIDINPDGSVVDAARLSLEPRLMTVVHHLPRAAQHADQDVEHVHRLRVSTRRAMAALKLYRDFLPRKQTGWVKKHLKKVRRAAGEARDLDVLAARFRKEYDQCAASVLSRIAEERAAVQPDIVEIAERFRRKEKFIRRTADLLEAIRCRSKRCRGNGSVNFRGWAHQQLTAQAHEFLDAVPGTSADMAALHQFRIQAKALRYSIELLASAFGSELRESHYRTIEELQERLGKINDHVAARDRLRGWAAEAADAKLSELLCEFAEEEVARLTAELGAWREWWTAERIESVRRGLTDPL